MLRALVVITIGLLLSGCALDAMGRPPPPSAPARGKVIKQAPVVPVPFGETKPATAKKVAVKAEKKEKKKRSWLFW